jgi:NTE family protein
MMRARRPEAPEIQIAGYAGSMGDEGSLSRRFPDLRGVPEGLLQDLGRLIRLEPLEASDDVGAPHGVLQANTPGLRLIFDGEVMVTRTPVSGASARVIVLGPGAVFEEQCLEELINELAPEVQTTDEFGVADYEDVRQSLGLSHVPGAHPVPGASRATATVASVLGVISVDDLRALAGSGPSTAFAGVWDRQDLVDFLVRIFQVNRFSDQALDALASVEGLERLSESERWWLLEGADYYEWPQGHRTGADAEWLYLLLDGEVEVFAGDAFSCMVLEPDQRNFLPMATSGESLDLHVTLQARLVAIRRDRIAHLLSQNVGFRRKVMHNTLPSNRIGMQARTIDRGSLEFVGLARHPDLLLPATDRALVGLLAQAIRAQFEDRVIVLMIEPGEDGDPLIEPAGRRHGISWTRVRASAESVVEVTWKAALQLAEHHDYALLDMSAWAAPPAALQLLVQKWAFLVDHPLQRVGVDRTPEAPVVPTVCVRQRRRSTDPCQSDCLPDLALAMPLRNTRLVLDEGEFARWRGQDEVPLDQLSVSRPSIDRWARAVTDRLVGIALGGGGAMGLCHLPLLERIHASGLPVDVVSGTSFGSVAAAYYCSVDEVPAGTPHPGLDKLRLLIPRMTGIALRGLWSGRILEKVVDEDLGAILLEKTPIPFIPVSTNAGTMGPVFPAGCTVGYGVWASGALPPVFSAPENRAAQVRFLDGAFVANVPADILIAAGASLIVASNPISPPLWAAGWVDRLENIVEIAQEPAMHPRDRQVAFRAALQGQTLDLDELQATAVERHQAPAARTLDLLTRALASQGDRVIKAAPALRTAWDRVRPRRIPDTIRGFQALLSKMGTESSRSCNVSVSPPLSILAAMKFWRGDDIAAIAGRHLEQEGTLEELESEWRRLRRPVRGVGPLD